MEAAQLRHQIREEQAVVRQHQQVVNQLRLLEDQHRKKRKTPSWDDQTPLIRLVNLQQIDRFRVMIASWQRRTEETLTLKDTFFFSFPPPLKHHIIRSLAETLQAYPPVFRVSTLELCRYLAAHSDLGDALAIHRALYRAKKAKSKESW